MRSKFLNVFFSGRVDTTETIFKSSACLVGISSAKNESCGFKTGLTQHQKASWCASCHFLPFLVLAKCSHHLTYRHVVTCILGILYCSKVNRVANDWAVSREGVHGWKKWKGWGKKICSFVSSKLFLYLEWHSTTLGDVLCRLTCCSSSSLIPSATACSRCPRRLF